MRFLERRGVAPADVVARARLPRGEKVLASALSTDGSWVLGTRRLLVLVGQGPSEEPRLIPWEQVEDATWDQDESRLHVSEIGQYGDARPAYDVELGDHPALLLQLVRERVTASIVLQRRVPVRGKQGLTVIGRRSPVGGPITWMHAYDTGLDPDDPEVVVVADLALSQARAEVGEDPADEVADGAPNPI